MGNNDRNREGQEPDLNQILKNKREKLANLQAAGKDPFLITKYDQTDHTADAKAAYEELEKKLLADHLWWRDGVFECDLGLLPGLAELFDVAVVLFAEVGTE